MGKDWGYKVIYYIYMEGEREDGQQVLDGASKLHDVFPDYNFIGARIESVKDEPHDQVAS